MLKRDVVSIVKYTWPIIIIALIILISIRLTWLYKSKRTINYRNEITNLLFLIYVLWLFQIVTFQDVSWSSSNYVPFKEIFRYDIGERLFFKNVVGNFLMFIPYGFFVSHYLGFKRARYILIMSFIASASIEYTQLIIGRVFDVDDIILNVSGALSGYFICKIFRSIVKKIPNILKNHNVFNIIKIILIIMVSFIVYIWVSSWWYKLNIIGVFNETKYDIEKEISEIKKLINYAIQCEQEKNLEFNIIFVNNELIRQLNKEYRNKDNYTDVISFALEDYDDIKYSNKRLLGDIYISVDKAMEQSTEYGHTVLRELAFLSIHGFLHLLGYNHENKQDEDIMFYKQEMILNEYGIKKEK